MYWSNGGMKNQFSILTKVEAIEFRFKKKKKCKRANVLAKSAKPRVRVFRVHIPLNMVLIILVKKTAENEW